MFNRLKKEEKGGGNRVRTDTFRRSIEIFNQDLASIFSRAETKRIAPPPPALSDFEQRIDTLRKRGLSRGKKYSYIGIIASLVISGAAIFLSVWIFRELIAINDKIDQRELMFEEIVESRSVRCDNDCCRDSLDIINRNHYQKANYLGECPVGQQQRSLSCEGSLAWCVPENK